MKPSPPTLRQQPPLPPARPSPFPQYECRPLIHSSRTTGVEWMQIVLGVAIFFTAYFAWNGLAGFLPSDTWRTWTLLGLFAALLGAIDALARAQWGWDRLRVGFVLALFAMAGFWGVRLWFWGVARWGT